MQNKNIPIRASHSIPSTRYYRSIKYKVTENISRQFTNATHYQTAYPDRPQHNTWRKSTSFSQCKHKNNSNVLNSSTNHNANPQLKQTYMQTWATLIKPVQKQDLQEDSKGRVNLPTLIQFDPSHFTSLDPLFLPFQHIEQGILKLKQQLPQPKIDMSQIHHDMINFKDKIIAELQNTENHGLKQFEKLRCMLRVQKVYNQQNKLRFKRQCDELFIQDQQFKSNFENTKPRLDILQSQIFSCKPFDLSRKQELDEQFPQQYF